MGSSGCPKMSVTSYQSTMPHIPGEQTPYLLQILLYLFYLDWGPTISSKLFTHKDTTKFDAATLTLNKDFLSYGSEMIEVQYSNKGTKWWFLS